ncbi:F510_1955 family glycosylhydrolase [Nocardioides sp. SYSU DS0663]|uniref:F510_1955 family glycosylhydrolase n=1 Tax=Nocardioides sp. SYSU DS0663 TaxID=3416445 RepID=UPI003F4B3E2F
MAPTLTAARRAGAVLAGLALVAGLGGCGSDDDPPRLAHVHDLGVDPADGALYAGSHHGLFQVGEGRLEGPLGGRVQDFMGFTVAGPGRFLASGHPGEGMGGPGSVGLIESTDGGKTWSTRSLAGEADFHALEYRHDTVYGLDSVTGALMVSRDLETWETRSAVPMADLAVSPTESGTLLGTTEAGPVLSTDGGRSFEPVAGAPAVLRVTWAEDGTLLAAAPDGTVYAGPAASSLEEVGDLGGVPEALHAQDADTVHAVVGGVVLTSTDGGATFEPATA